MEKSSTDNSQEEGHPLSSRPVFAALADAPAASSASSSPARAPRAGSASPAETTGGEHISQQQQQVSQPQQRLLQQQQALQQQEGLQQQQRLQQQEERGVDNQEEQEETEEHRSEQQQQRTVTRRHSTGVSRDIDSQRRLSSHSSTCDLEESAAASPTSAAIPLRDAVAGASSSCGLRVSLSGQQQQQPRQQQQQSRQQHRQQQRRQGKWQWQQQQLFVEEQPMGLLLLPVRHADAADIRQRSTSPSSRRSGASGAPQTLATGSSSSCLSEGAGAAFVSSSAAAAFASDGCASHSSNSPSSNKRTDTAAGPRVGSNNGSCDAGKGSGPAGTLLPLQQQGQPQYSRVTTRILNVYEASLPHPHRGQTLPSPAGRAAGHHLSAAEAATGEAAAAPGDSAAAGDSTAVAAGRAAAGGAAGGGAAAGRAAAGRAAAGGAAGRAAAGVAGALLRGTGSPSFFPVRVTSAAAGGVGKGGIKESAIHTSTAALAAAATWRSSSEQMRKTAAAGGVKSHSEEVGAAVAGDTAVAAAGACLSTAAAGVAIAKAPEVFELVPVVGSLDSLVRRRRARRPRRSRCPSTRQMPSATDAFRGICTPQSSSEVVGERRKEREDGDGEAYRGAEARTSTGRDWSAFNEHVLHQQQQQPWLVPKGEQQEDEDE